MKFSVKSIFSVLLVFSTVLISTSLYAQAPPPASNPPGAPIDAMVAVLLIAGVGYGIYRSKQKETVQQ